MKNVTEDRISYSYGFKWPGAVDYSTVQVNINYSSDVRDGETLEGALERIKKFVQKEVEKEFDEVQKEDDIQKGVRRKKGSKRKFVDED